MSTKKMFKPISKDEKLNWSKILKLTNYKYNTFKLQKSIQYFGLSPHPIIICCIACNIFFSFPIIAHTLYKNI